MGEIAYLLAAIIAKMLDPLILAAGVVPALLARRWASVGAAAMLGGALGLFVYLMSGRSVSPMVLPICAVASLLWWAVAAAARAFYAARRNNG